MGQYLLQGYIKQEKIDLIVHEREPKKIEAKGVNWGFVGSMFCINQIVLPLVFWRVTLTDIIAFGQGGLVVAGLAVNQGNCDLRACQPPIGDCPIECSDYRPNDGCHVWVYTRNELGFWETLVS